MKYIRIILISWVILLSGCNKEAMDNYSVTNHKIDGPIPYSFTVYKHKSRSDENTVLYYLHGSGGNDRIFLTSHNDLIKTWEKNKYSVPVVVGISFGDRWVLVPKNSSNISGYLEYFIDIALPQIENKLNDTIERRYLLGISMGGYNASQLVFRHPEHFNKAAIISPSILPFSLYADDVIINEYSAKVRKNISGLRLLINYHLLKKDTIRGNVNSITHGRRRDFIPDHPSWVKADIINNMKEPPNKHAPLIYISCGNKDEFGFFYGAELLAEKARSLAYPVKLSTVKGGHMARDEKEIADFFIND